jgi:hypothetical protein
MIKGRSQNFAKRSFFRTRNRSLVKRCVKLTVVKRITEINPAHTESSKTAANGEFKRNIIIESMTLVIAKPNTALTSLVVITVQRLAKSKQTRRMEFISI